MRLIPASRAVCPSLKNRRHPCRGRAPCAERCEILFFGRSWGTVRLVPRRHRPPPRGDPPKGWPTAGADGLKAKARTSPVGSLVARLGLVSLCQFSRRENIGVCICPLRSHELTMIPPALHALLISSMFPLGILNCAATFSSADSTVSPCFL